MTNGRNKNVTATLYIWPLICLFCILIYKHILLPLNNPLGREVLFNLALFLLITLLALKRKSKLLNIIQFILSLCILVYLWLDIGFYIALHAHLSFSDLINNYSYILLPSFYTREILILGFMILIPAMFLFNIKVKLKFHHSDFNMITISVLLMVTFAYLFIGVFGSSAPAVAYFKNIQGPMAPSTYPKPVVTPISKYAAGSDSRLAVLLTNERYPWLGLARGFKSIGIPFIITTDYREALKHKVIMIYPEISEAFPEAARTAIKNHLLNGGTVIANIVDLKEMQPLFGFNNWEAANKQNKIQLNTTLPIMHFFTAPEEKNMIVAYPPEHVELATSAYLNPAEVPLATYSNGTAAIIQKSYPNGGKAYAIGVDVGLMASLGYDYGLADLSSYYSNHYQPNLDVFLRLIKNMYVVGQKNAVIIGTVPFGRAFTVMLTHDLCFSDAYKYLRAYVDFERKNNISATYFVTTKYIKDWTDIAYFNDHDINILRKVNEKHMELGSHSVSHPLEFNKYPIGTGREKYPNYAPYSVNKNLTLHGDIFGELRISKFLIQTFIPNLKVVSFRAGYLRTPAALPQILQATNYKYDSSTSANESLSHLPFQLTFDRKPDALVPIFEFPVTIWDNPDEKPYIYLQLNKVLEIADKIKRYGGIFVILIHPSEFGAKLAFEKNFVKAIGDSAWYSSIKDFGAWWAARNEIGIDVEDDHDKLIVDITAPSPIAGLTLYVPPKWEYDTSSPALAVHQQDRQIVIDQLDKNAKLIFKPAQKN